MNPDDQTDLDDERRRTIRGLAYGALFGLGLWLLGAVVIFLLF